MPFAVSTFLQPSNPRRFLTGEQMERVKHRRIDFREACRVPGFVDAARVAPGWPSGSWQVGVDRGAGVA
jgi:hypothetical protein